MIRISALAALSALMLAACSEGAEDTTADEAVATPAGEAGFGGDVARATREAAADVEAAAREAGSMDAPVARRPAPVIPAGSTEPTENSDPE